MAMKNSSEGSEPVSQNCLLDCSSTQERSCNNIYWGSDVFVWVLSCTQVCLCTWFSCLRYECMNMIYT